MKKLINAILTGFLIAVLLALLGLNITMWKWWLFASCVWVWYWTLPGKEE